MEFIGKETRDGHIILTVRERPGCLERGWSEVQLWLGRLLLFGLGVLVGLLLRG